MQLAVRRILFLVFSVLAFGAGVLPGLAPSLALAQPAEEEVVKVSAHASVRAANPNEPFLVGVMLDHQDPWHTHTNDPKIPKSWGEFPAIPTTLTLQAGSSKGVSLGPVTWPTPKTIKMDLMGTGKPEPYAVFAGKALIVVPVKLAADAFEAGKATLRFNVSFQACDDSICLMEETRVAEVMIPLATSSVLPANADLFSTFDASTLPTLAFTPAQASTSPPVSDAGGPNPLTSGDATSKDPTLSPQPWASTPANRSFFGIPLPEEGGLGTLLVFVGLAALGGFLLNLTPCVLPVLPLKVMAIVQHAGSPKRTLYLGLWMAAGVIAFWVACAVPVLALSSFADPSRIFGIWWVTLGLGLLIALMSLGLMGLFNITLPQAVYAVNPKADSAWGSFLFGVMTAVLGLPCFGFVAGSLLAAAATLPKVMTLAIFVGMGVGMALPYFVLALKPGWIKKIPRTGPASELVKQVMGLLLLAAGVFFVGAGLIALVAEMPWVAKQLHVWVAALLGVVAGLWMLVRVFQISKQPLPRAVFSVASVFVALAGLWYANNVTTRAKANHIAREQAMAINTEGRLIPGVWLDYSPALIATAQRENKVIVMDFTAEWCLNCKALKAAVLDREPVKSKLKDDRIVLVTVDLTAKSAPGWQRLRALGQRGIPLLAVYSPGKEQPWLANNYTSDQVFQAVGQALASLPSSSESQVADGR